MIVPDVWSDIFPVNSMAKERLGYPTQKPVALLERIINACSDEGDWVLDPFCGCGTAVIAAEKLQRHWIGIDITYLAINLIKNRVSDFFPHARFIVEGEPRDLEAAYALERPLPVPMVGDFAHWGETRGSKPSNPREGKKGADQAIDGILRFGDGNSNIERIIVQVKSGHVGVKDIRELRDAVNSQYAAMGIFITLEEPTSEMVKEVNATEPYRQPTWQRDYPKLQIMTIEELLKGNKPDIPPTVSPFLEAPLEKRASTALTGNLKLT